MRWESQNPRSVGRALAWVGANTSAIAFLFFFLLYLFLKKINELINLSVIKMNKFLYFLLLLFIVVGCNNIPDEDITIIDNIVLGKPSTNFNKQMDSLLLPHQPFMTKTFFYNYDEILDNYNYINMYYSNIFNFSDERSDHNEHYGLFYPITLTGTNNNMGLIVLLGHTRKPYLSSDVEKNANLTTEKNIVQDVNENVIDKIEKLYISKYGKPYTDYKSEYNLLYVIENNDIKKYTDTTRVGREIMWKTEYMNISLFTGLDSYDCTYDKEKRYYTETIWTYGKRIVAKKNLAANEMPSYSFAYIKYELNDLAIEKLKLDKKKI
jgi:hypothetical protein